MNVLQGRRQPKRTLTFPPFGAVEYAHVPNPPSSLMGLRGHTDNKPTEWQPPPQLESPCEDRSGWLSGMGTPSYCSGIVPSSYPSCPTQSKQGHQPPRPAPSVILWARRERRHLEHRSKIGRLGHWAWGTRNPSLMSRGKKKRDPPHCTKAGSLNSFMKPPPGETT